MFLRVVGSKYRVADRLMSLAPIEYAEYREPFCGSATILWKLPPGKRIWINDVNPDVIRFLKALRGQRGDPEYPDFIDRILDLKQSLDTDAKVKDYWNQAKEEFALQRDPVAYLFLSRYAIGGFLRRDRSNIANFDFSYLGKDGDAMRPITRRKLEEAREKLAGARITCGDYSQLLSAPAKNGDVWILADPPYGNGTGVYEHAFSYDQHVRLAMQLKQCKHRFLMTMGDDEQSRRLYGRRDFRSPFRLERGFQIDKCPHKYSRTPARRRQKGILTLGIRNTEMIVRNYDWTHQPALTASLHQEKLPYRE